MVLGVIVIKYGIVILNIIGNYKILGILLLLLVFEIKGYMGLKMIKR